MLELTPDQQLFVDAQVAQGGYRDPAEVVQAGIELLRKAIDRDSSQTVKEIREVVPDLEARRGRALEEADASIREKLGFTKSQ